MDRGALVEHQFTIVSFKLSTFLKLTDCGSAGLYYIRLSWGGYNSIGLVTIVAHTGRSRLWKFRQRGENIKARDRRVSRNPYASLW